MHSTGVDRVARSWRSGHLQYLHSALLVALFKFPFIHLHFPPPKPIKNAEALGEVLFLSLCFTTLMPDSKLVGHRPTNERVFRDKVQIRVTEGVLCAHGGMCSCVPLLP